MPQLQASRSMPPSPSYLSSLVSPEISPSMTRNMSTAMTASPFLLVVLGQVTLGTNGKGAPAPPPPAGSGLLRRQFGDQAERHCETLQLILRLEKELRRVVTRVPLHLFDDDFGRGQRLSRLVVL